MSEAHSGPVCKPCGVLMVKGPKCYRCLNCGAAEAIETADEKTARLAVEQSGMAVDMALQLGECIESMIHDLRRALNMPGEPWDVLLARAKDNAKGYAKWLAMSELVRDEASR